LVAAILSLPPEPANYQGVNDAHASAGNGEQGERNQHRIHLAVTLMRARNQAFSVEKRRYHSPADNVSNEQQHSQ